MESRPNNKDQNTLKAGIQREQLTRNWPSAQIFIAQTCAKFMRTAVLSARTKKDPRTPQRQSGHGNGSAMLDLLCWVNSEGLKERPSAGSSHLSQFYSYVMILLCWQDCHCKNSKKQSYKRIYDYDWTTHVLATKVSSFPYFCSDEWKSVGSTVTTCIICSTTPSTPVL